MAVNREFKHAAFLSHGGQPEVRCFRINLSLDYLIYIVKYLFTSRDDYFENLRNTPVLACEVFTSGCRPWLKNVACLSSLIAWMVREEELEEGVW